MTSEKGYRKDKNQNIQVFVRLRPLNQRERDIKSLGVVEVLNNREVVVRQSHQSVHTKKFTFDRAFAPHAKQVEVYQQVVSPLIEEVLAGYNCTVFAYGQTGTGKTHTMVGESTGDETNWQSDPLAGIIPRALSQLFDELRISNTEYNVRVSYLELYNEELFDLLSSSEDNSKLRIYEDVTRKGANIVNGLEEITVYNKNEVYKIMAQGQERKKVASTLMNAQSSRSHTVFTIVVHMKENSPEGEELVKIGKLNLVDLAGSENISKAGSDNPAKRERARECVNINQSLLTLGRVITALVERHPHIPYRESKLTRILQESLGGRTKTSIIATISPGHKDLEETMSTLEYANRAKNIQNKPEVNQKMTKKAILKEFSEEIDKLKRDLQAARDKNGVYLANETFAEITLKDEEQRKEIQELLLKKRAMEEEKDKMEAVFGELNQTLQERISELNNTKNVLQMTNEQLANTKNVLQSTKLHYEEQKHLVHKHRDTEIELSGQARDILAAADVATNHVQRLHETVDKRRTVESSNLQVTQTYRQQASQLRENVAAGAQNFAEKLTKALMTLYNQTDGLVANSTQCLEDNKEKLEELVQKIVESMDEAKSISAESHGNLSSHSSEQRACILQSVEAQRELSKDALESCTRLAAAAARSASSSNAPDAIASLVQRWLSDSVERVSSLRRAHAAFETRARDAEIRRGDVYRRQRDARKQRAQRACLKIDTALAELEAEKAMIDLRLTKQLSYIETERKETEERLNAWMEEERRLLEERLSRHVATEKKALETRLQKKVDEIEEEKTILDKRMKIIEEWRKEQITASDEESKLLDSEIGECENGREECLKYFDKFGKEFDDGTSAVSADLEAFSGNIIQISDHYNKELLQIITQAAQQIEEQANCAISSEEQSAKQLVDCTDSMLSTVLQTNKQTMDTVLNKIESTASVTISSLTQLTTSTSDLIAASRASLASHTASIKTLHTDVEQFNNNLRQALTQHAEIENVTLGEKFRVYSPTGKTPVRQEYRYPRNLAATSPHERILARFRAMRQNSNDEDCVLVESDPETRPTSDSESSVSEDSAVAFAAPSPPDSLCALANINKSKSETNIYHREQQGKENTQYHPVSLKKSSRLPAPTSHKKPLVERN